MFRYFFLILVCLFAFNSKAIKLNHALLCIDSSKHVVVFENSSFVQNKPNPVFEVFKKRQRLNKKITVAVLAFPFPFGIVGLHRIYLGTKPHVPIVYIGTLGGIFGLLPFIDFCAVIFTKDIEHYRHNDNVFMWIKN